MDRIIAAERTRNGLTQEQLALRIGVSVNSVASWEQGRATPGSTYLGKLADTLGVSADYLLGRTENRGGC